MFSLELPHRGNSNEYTQYTIFNVKKKKEKITLVGPKSAATRFFSKDLLFVVALLFYVHGKHLRSSRDGQLT